jgi:hypothetical protein
VSRKDVRKNRSLNFVTKLERGKYWKKFTYVVFFHILPPHLWSPFPPTTCWFRPETLYIHTKADRFPRSPWKLKSLLGDIFRRRTLLFLSLAMYFLWSSWILYKGPEPKILVVEAAYAPGLWLAPAQQQYYVLQYCCTLCTVPVYKPLCMQ